MRCARLFWIGRSLWIEDGAADGGHRFGQHLQPGAVVGIVEHRQPDGAVAALVLFQAGEIALAGQHFQPQLGDAAPVAQVVAPATVAVAGRQRDEHVERVERVQCQAGDFPRRQLRCAFIRAVVCGFILGCIGGEQPGREEGRVGVGGQQQRTGRIGRGGDPHGECRAEHVRRGGAGMRAHCRAPSPWFGGVRRGRGLTPDEERLPVPRAVQDDGGEGGGGFVVHRLSCRGLLRQNSRWARQYLDFTRNLFTFLKLGDFQIVAGL